MQAEKLLGCSRNLLHVHLLLEKEVVILAENTAKPRVEAIVNVGPRQHANILRQAPVNPGKVVTLGQFPNHYRQHVIER